jgi:sulfide:quinone oxidoreductase
MPGVPCDGAGFILVDDTFRVRDASDVFAVGDGTAGADKQGGLAAQQADVVAEHIAQRAGAEHAPRPYRPVLRGLLRTGHGHYYLQAQPPDGTTSAAVSEQCLWWPPNTIAARWLVPWLAARHPEERHLPSPRRLASGGIVRAVSR